MKKWIQSLKEKWNNRMERAYGFDEFVIELIVVGMFLVLLDLLTKVNYISFLGMFLLLWGCYRCYSTDTEARTKELRIYENIKSCIAEWCTEQFGKIKDRMAYKYVKCPHCGTVIKLPRGAGRVTITCPKCNNNFNKYI